MPKLNLGLVAVAAGAGALFLATRAMAEEAPPAGTPAKGAATPGTPAPAPGAAQPAFFPGAGPGPGATPGAASCIPCEPFAPIGEGQVPCAGCIGAPILPFPFHFLVGSPLPLPGYWSLPDPSAG